MANQYLTFSHLNQGTAFKQLERERHGLRGRLPPIIESLDQQVDRAWWQLNSYQTALHKHIYLMDLYSTDETLFFRLVATHVKEILPLIYTPTVGLAVQHFSEEFRRSPRGLYLTYEDRDNLPAILASYANELHQEVKIVVVTDGERVLGLGDQGVGGFYIAVAKGLLYTLFANLDAIHILPITLDLGTNNQALRDHRWYLGRRYPRLPREEYDQFMDTFVNAIKQVFPNVLLHWEDFGRDNAQRYLSKYREQICSFNDDIQGTGAVVLAAVLAAVKAIKSSLSEQRVVIFGAGSAGTGIADQLVFMLVRQGMSKSEACQRIWLIDKHGLLTENSKKIDTFILTSAQEFYLREANELKNWNIVDEFNITLFEVVQEVKPTILVGCSGVGGAFTQEIIQTMAKYSERPIILPISNPNEKTEATPEDLITWTNGKALVATGSPFEPVWFGGKKIEIAQCNNALFFPGLGVGVITTKVGKITDDLLLLASLTLSDHAPILVDLDQPLLPNVVDAAKVASEIVKAIANINSDR